MISKRKFIIWMVCWLWIFILVGIVAFFLFYPKKLHSDYALMVKRGDSLSVLTRQLKKDDIVYSKSLLLGVSYLSGTGRNLKKGVYHFKGNMSTWDIVKKLDEGPDKIIVRIIEGKTLKSIRKQIDNMNGVIHLTKDLSDHELLKKIDSDSSYPYLEGLLFPARYDFHEGIDDIEIYRYAYQLMVKELKKIWEKRPEDLSYKNAYELLIMASIIEKETGHAEDRYLISAVFNNRLKKKMRLQTDPTVIYGMAELYQGKITKKDLLTDTPHNTYTRYGLPPSPIAIPSKASLEAAIAPAQVDFLYFVSKKDGTGKSYFSRDLFEHNKAVRQYILKKN